MGWAVSRTNGPGQPAAAEPAFSCLFGLLDNFESRSWKGWRLNSLFFPTSTRCCLKPQRCAGLKPQPCCAAQSRPVPSSSPQRVPGAPPARLPSSSGPSSASSRCQRRKQSSGNTCLEGSQPHTPGLAQGKGLLPPPGHSSGSGQPTGSTAQHSAAQHSTAQHSAAQHRAA